MTDTSKEDTGTHEVPKGSCGGPNGDHRFSQVLLTKEGRRTCGDCGEVEVNGPVFKEDHPVGDPRDEAPPAKAYSEGEGEHEKAPTEEAPKAPSPVTAFLVVLFPDGHVEAMTNVEGFAVERAPGLRDIRDMCASLNADVTATIHANMLSQSMSRSIQQAMQARQIAAVQTQLGGGGMGAAMASRRKG